MTPTASKLEIAGIVLLATTLTLGAVVVIDDHLARWLLRLVAVG